MTLRYVTGSTILTSDDAFTAASDDFIVVAAGAVLSGTDGIDAPTSQSNISVLVQGLVHGASCGINLTSVGGYTRVTVAEGGSVFGEVSAVSMSTAILSEFCNYGLVQAISQFQSDVVVLASTTNFILNAGLISCAIPLSVGVTASGTTSTLVNSGTIVGPRLAVDFSATIGTTTIWNSGELIGDVQLGGNGLYQGGGRVRGTIIGGGGSDTIIGGAFDNVIRDTSSTNWLAGGGGADRIIIGNLGGQGASVIFGGESGGPDSSGNDTLAFTSVAGGSAVTVRLDLNYATTATNVLLAVMSGIENATGTSQADSLFGSAAANVLDGDDGFDWLVGNGGADTFRFSLANHADSDQIRDFRRSENDRIDISAIDANSTSPLSNEAFVFSTSRTSNLAGEVVVTNYGVSAVVELHTNTDNLVDGTFVVVFGETTTTSLTALDFLL